MHVLCCYIDFVQSNCADALRLYAPDAEYVEMDKEDIYLYAKVIGDHWDRGDSLLIVEPDNEITQEVIEVMTGCDHDWCSFGYDIFSPPLTRECITGLGCTKFSAKAQSRLNYQKRVIDEVCDKCGSHHNTWGELDCRISHLMEHDLGLSVYKHGTINHYHPYKAYGEGGDDIDSRIVSVCYDVEASIRCVQPE